jgi:ribonuclease P protein component
VDRNLAKRKIRESFRLAQDRLGDKDIVVQLMRGKDLDGLIHHLENAWKKLV